MWIVILFFLGYYLKYKNFIHFILDKNVHIMLYVMQIFLMVLIGIKIGFNKNMIKNIGYIGLKSSLLTIGAIVGSIIMSKLYEAIFIRNNLN